MVGGGIPRMATQAMVEAMAGMVVMAIVAVAIEVWVGCRGRQLSLLALAFTGLIRLTASRLPPSS